MRPRSAVPATIVAIAAIVYWRTAYPTITWWDSSSYSLAAATLGVASAPGSLLLTLLGWPVAKLASPAATAHALNLLAGALAATCVALVYLVARALRRAASHDVRAGAPRAAEIAAAVGAATGALTFAFTDTLWDYAVKFTPYVLSAVFTGLILWTMVRWWESAERPDAWRWIALLGLLFGADFSVHRTNALLIPGALAWILIRRPTALGSPRVLLTGAGGLAAGLAVQLLIIPMSAFGHSPLDFHAPNTLSRFWSYITLERLGGGFLFQLYPRKSDLWSVQTVDFLRVLATNFVNWQGQASVLGAVPGLAALAGFVALWRANRRLGAAVTAVIVLQAAATVLYFNIPANYFRSFERHYLPVCVTIAVVAAYGLASVMESAARWATAAPRHAMTIPVALAAGMLLGPVTQLVAHWRMHDASKRYFTHDWATNALQGLPPNAIYFTAGDNDTFPVMYVQAVEGVRRDVTMINLSVAQMPEWAARMRARDASFPLDARVTPMAVARGNSGGRPVTYATTVTSASYEWPDSLARLEGLYWRVVPRVRAGADVETTRTNLLEKSLYRGYADESVLIDDETRTMGFQYYEAMKGLLAAEPSAEQCRADLARFVALVPPGRLGVDRSPLAVRQLPCHGAR